MSPRPPKTGKGPSPGPKSAKETLALPRNPQRYAQTRKILSKHYRTKYGMRQERGGRKR